MPSAWAKFGRRSVPVERQFPEMSQGKLVPFNEEEGRNRRPISLGPSRMLVDALTGPLGAVAQMAGAWAKLPGDESKEPVGQAAVPKWLLMALSAPKDMDAVTKQAYQEALMAKARKEPQNSILRGSGSYIQKDQRLGTVHDFGLVSDQIGAREADMLTNARAQQFVNHEAEKLRQNKDEFFPFNDTRFGYTDPEGNLHADLAEQLYKRELPKYSINYEKPILTSADESRWDEFLREQGLSNRTDRNTKESIANEAEKRKADLFELLGPPKAKK